MKCVIEAALEIAHVPDLFPHHLIGAHPGLREHDVHDHRLIGLRELGGFRRGSCADGRGLPVRVRPRRYRITPEGRIGTCGRSWFPRCWFARLRGRRRCAVGYVSTGRDGIQSCIPDQRRELFGSIHVACATAVARHRSAEVDDSICDFADYRLPRAAERHGSRLLADDDPRGGHDHPRALGDLEFRLSVLGHFNPPE